MKKFITVGATVVFCGLLAACSTGSKGTKSATDTSKVSQVQGHKTTAREKGTDKKAASRTKKKGGSNKSLEINYEDYDLKDQKIYPADITDNSWGATKVVIDQVEVDQVEPQKYDSANDGKFDVNGFVRLHLTVTATRDINFYPTQGMAIYNDGQQQEATGNESWDGEIAKGVTKDGWVSFPVKELDNVNALTSVRFKFSADYETDDYEDDGAYQDYDLTLNLQK